MSRLRPRLLWPRPRPQKNGFRTKIGLKDYMTVQFPPFYPRSGPKWRDNYPEGLDHPVAPQSSGIIMLLRWNDHYKCCRYFQKGSLQIYTIYNIICRWKNKI